MMILLSFQALPFAVFLAIVLSVAAAEQSEHLCDRTTYGIPQYSACLALLYGNAREPGKGIFSIDNKEHGFFLPYFASSVPFTVDQWRHRVELPQVWENTECKIALLVESRPTGGFTTDIGTWAGIAISGKDVLDRCMLTERVQAQSGGAGYAGVLGKLNIVIFKPGSLFDRVVTSDFRSGRLGGGDRNGTLVLTSVKGRNEVLSRA